MFSFIFGPQLRAGQYQPDGSGNPVWATDLDENGDPVDVEPPEGADWGNDDPDTLPNWLEDYYGTDRYNPDTMETASPIAMRLQRPGQIP